MSHFNSQFITQALLAAKPELALVRLDSLKASELQAIAHNPDVRKAYGHLRSHLQSVPGRFSDRKLQVLDDIGDRLDLSAPIANTPSRHLRRPARRERCWAVRIKITGSKSRDVVESLKVHLEKYLESIDIGGLANDFDGHYEYELDVHDCTDHAPVARGNPHYDAAVDLIKSGEDRKTVIFHLINVHGLSTSMAMAVARQAFANVN